MRCLKRQIPVLLACLFLSFTAKAERYVLDFNDWHLQGQSTIALKQELQRRYGNLPFQRMDLQRVVLLAKSAYGGARATLVVGPQQSNPQIIPGNPRDFQNPANYTYTRLRFNPPSGNDRGIWQLHINGNVKVRRVVVVAQMGYQPPAPQPPAPPAPGRCPYGYAEIPDRPGQCGQIFEIYAGKQILGVCGAGYADLDRCYSEAPGTNTGARCYHSVEFHGTCIAGYNCPQDSHPNYMRSRCGGKYWDARNPGYRCVFDGRASSVNCL